MQKPAVEYKMDSLYVQDWVDQVVVEYRSNMLECKLFESLIMGEICKNYCVDTW